MERNLTLAIDEAVLKAARKIALDRDTSVNQLVRDFLAKLVNEQDERKRAAERIRENFRTFEVEIGERTWSRDELHER